MSTNQGHFAMPYRRILPAILFGAGVLATGVPAALAEPPSTPPRADAYYVVMCLAPGATEPSAFERFDAHAVDPGGKDEQIARYGQHHEGWRCWLEPAA